MNELAPSPWVQRFASLIPAGGRVLDVACGTGRHACLLAALGCRVEAVDRDAEALVALNGRPGLAVRVADLEGDPWPYARESFDGIVVTNYLHRPRLGALLDTLAPKGVLLYETFMRGNEAFGRPSNPDYLLQPDELLECVRGRMTIVAFEQGRVDSPKPACVQRLCAIKALAKGAGMPDDPVPLGANSVHPHRLHILP